MKKSIAGFTLIEVMVVVAIIAILASIAIPSYQNSVAKARRADVRGALVSFAASMERRFTENNSYCNNADDNGSIAAGADDCVEPGDTRADTGPPRFFSPQVPIDGGNAYYDLTIRNVTRSSFTLIATRTANGVMDGDDCGDFIITSAGVKDVVNATLTRDQCWNLN